MNLDCFERHLAPASRVGADQQGNQQFTDLRIAFRQTQAAAKEGECFATSDARPFRDGTCTA